MNKIIKSQIEEEKGEVDIFNKENYQNASALLALMHGKSDSMCRVFDKEITINLNAMKKLNDVVQEKLFLHGVDTITTSIDLALSDKKVITFKSWQEFQNYDFEIINSSVNSIFIQWDFFVEFNHKIPQRHTINVRISSSPRPSEFLKAILNGGFDEEDAIEMKLSTTICKVDFINNTLAEELLFVVERWNELCEDAISKKSNLSKLIYNHQNKFTSIFEICFLTSIMLVIAIVAKKYILVKGADYSNEFLFLIFLALVPLNRMTNVACKFLSNKLTEKFRKLGEIHIFQITLGDTKKIEKINTKLNFKKEIFWYMMNSLMTLILSIIFLLLSFSNKS